MPFDKRFIGAYYGDIFGKDAETVENNEILYLANPELKKFQGSKVLVVGAGPSTIECEWNTDKYDYVFSCNTFFLNDKLKNIDVSLVTIGPEVDTSDENEKLHEYLENNSVLFSIESMNVSMLVFFFVLVVNVVTFLIC